MAEKRLQTPEKKYKDSPVEVLVTNPDEEFNILGEIKGGMPKGEFRIKLKQIINPS